jgi:hypothetical protein
MATEGSIVTMRGENMNQKQIRRLRTNRAHRVILS